MTEYDNINQIYYKNMIEYNHIIYVNRILLSSFYKNENMRILPKYRLVDRVLQKNFNKNFNDYCKNQNIYYDWEHV